MFIVVVAAVLAVINRGIKWISYENLQSYESLNRCKKRNINRIAHIAKIVAVARLFVPNAAGYAVTVSDLMISK